MSKVKIPSAISGINPRKGKLVYHDGDFLLADNLKEGCRFMQFTNLFFKSALVKSLIVRGYTSGAVRMSLFLQPLGDEDKGDIRAAFREQELVPFIKECTEEKGVWCYKTEVSALGQMTKLLKVVDVLVGLPDSHRVWLFGVAMNPSKYCEELSKEVCEKLKKAQDENENHEDPSPLLREIRAEMNKKRKAEDAPKKAVKFARKSLEPSDDEEDDEFALDEEDDE
jgi:hypothetical protein